MDDHWRKTAKQLVLSLTKSNMSSRDRPDPVDLRGDGFEKVFAPLAHHLFPDGCPAPSPFSTSTELVGTIPNIDKVWPQRQDRKVIPVSKAKESITALQNYAKYQGLTELQLSAVALCLSAVATSHTTGTASNPSTYSQISKDDQTFDALVKCLLPAPRSTGIPPNIISLLLSIVTVKDRLTPVKDETVSTQRSCVLRFLTLTALAMADFSLEMESKESLTQQDNTRWQLERVSPLIFAVIFESSDKRSSSAATEVVDAIRLSLLVLKPRHTRVSNARRLQRRFDSLIRHRPEFVEQSDKTKSKRRRVISSSQYHTMLQAFIALLQLHADFNEACRRIINIPGNDQAVSAFSWTEFPDPEWKEAFIKRSRPQRKEPRTDTLAYPTSPNLTTIPSLSANNLTDFLAHPSVLFYARLYINSTSNSSVPTEEIQQRLNTVLPQVLREIWHPQSMSDPTSFHPLVTRDRCSFETLNRSRCQVLSALAVFCTRTDHIPPAVEDFVLKEVLPIWDGDTAEGSWGNHLARILQYLSPCSFGRLRQRVLEKFKSMVLFAEHESVIRVIVSEILSSIVHRWGRLDWTRAFSVATKEAVRSDNIRRSKTKVLRRLIQWTDHLLLQALLSNRGNGWNDTARCAAIDFFLAVSDLNNHGPFLEAPSPSLCYRLFLSRSAALTDRFCHLLVQYKRSFKRLKDEQGEDGDNTAKDQRIKIYNCYIWDICSALWRCSPFPQLGPDATLSASILFTDLRPETLSILSNGASSPKAGTTVWNDVPKALSITHGPAFVGLSMDFVETYSGKHGNKGRMIIENLKGKTKVRYLSFLKNEHGMTGVDLFLSTFIASLAKKR